MSFTSDEMQRLQSYVNQDAEASALFQKLLHSQDMERHKICHEIRNPLTLLSGTLQLIESRHPEVRSFEYWDSLCQDLEYMMHLLEEFSLFNNSSSLHPETFSFRSFMEKLVLSFAASCANTEIEFTSLLEDLPVITGDPVKLRQALLNLFKNAVESIHRPGTHITEQYPWIPAPDLERLLRSLSRYIPGFPEIQSDCADTGHGIDPCPVYRLSYSRNTYLLSAVFCYIH